MNTMLIISDNKMPHEAKVRLGGMGEFVGLQTHGIVYDSISGHPDIFFHHFDNNLVYSPQLPDFYIEKISDCSLNRIEASSLLGYVYPTTAQLNATFTQKHLICNQRFIDKSIIQLHLQQEVIHVKQGYAACNTLVAENSVLCSDVGISKALISRGYKVDYFNPKDIILQGMPYGFIGGCTSIHDGNLFVIGSLDFIEDAKVIQAFAELNKLKIIELYHGPLFDCGGILFLPTKAN